MAKKKARRNRHRPLVLLLFLIGACSFIWAEVFLKAQNSLYVNDRWIVQKLMSSLGSPGGVEFLFNHSALADNTLDLGKNFGFQDVTLRQPVEPNLVRFRFTVPDESYLDFSYNRDDHGFSGVRLSRRSDLPSLVFESTPLGGFDSKAKIGVGEISGDWHLAEIKSTDQGMFLKIDGATAVRLPARPFIKGQVGFRGGLLGAQIDDVMIQNADGQLVSESFENTKHRARAVALFHFLFLLIAAGVFIVSKNPIRRCLVHFVVNACIAGICLAAEVWVFSGLEFQFINGAVANRTYRPLDYLGHVRFRAVEYIGLALGEDRYSVDGMVRRGYPKDRIWGGPFYCNSREPARSCAVIGDAELAKVISAKKKSFRLLFVGQSQMAGLGARVLEETVFERTHREVLKSLPHSFSVESLNFASALDNISGAKLLDDYKSKYLNFAPDLVVLGLTRFESKISPTADDIAEILRLNQSKRIRTVIIEKTYCKEDKEAWFTHMLQQSHMDYKVLARRYGVSLYPLDEFLSRPETKGSGNLWHDTVHLTSYGQELVAGWLAPRLKSELMNRKLPL